MTREIKLKGYAVFWSKSAWKTYGITYRTTQIIGTETDVNYRKRKPGTMKFWILPVFAEYAIFKTKKDAELFRDGNSDWEVRPIYLKYDLY
jgi:hypothetical protein